jgi:hypothetical protein
MQYAVEAFAAAVAFGWIAREFTRFKSYRASCTARLRRSMA